MVFPSESIASLLLRNSVDKHMYILSLDTSTKNFSLAVSKDDMILAKRNVILKKVLSDSIMTSIDGILKKAKINLAKIDGFAVGLGPGSFTSLRVGLATVKGLAFATNKPVVGISSLDVIALGSEYQGGTICSICDAKRNMVYAGLYRANGSGLIKKMTYQLSAIEDLLTKIKRKTVFIGDGIEIFKKEIEKSKKVEYFERESLWYPKAENLAQLALKRFKMKKTDNINTLVPIYLYPQDCQVRR